MKELDPVRLAMMPVAEKRARQILREAEAGGVPLWGLLARAYLIGIQDAVESVVGQGLDRGGDVAKEPQR